MGYGMHGGSSSYVQCMYIYMLYIMPRTKARSAVGDEIGRIETRN